MSITTQHLSLFTFLLTPIYSRTISEQVETKYVPPAVYQVGTGKGYHKASDLFRGALNESADACEDFFEFACGRWVALNKIPDDLTSYGHFSEIREKVNREMKDLYEDPTPSTSKSINILKQFYAACMDTKNLDASKSKHILKDIESFGHWPILHPEKWAEFDFDFAELIINIVQSRALDVFVDVYVSQDQRNVSRRLLHFDQGGLGLGSTARDYYLNDTKYAKQLAAYEKLMNVRIGLLAEDSGSKRSKEQIAADAKEILAFEKQLAKIMVSEDDRRNFTRLYNKHRLSEINKLIPIMDWYRYFRALMPFELHNYINSDPEIIINEPEYFLNLAELIKSTDPRVLTNYVIWRFTGSWSLQMDERFEDISQEFLRNFIGKQSKSPRWKDCQSAVSTRLTYSSGAMYVRKHFKIEDREAVQEMVKDLREAFSAMLHQNEWMNGETKEYALKKAHEMQNLIGFPDMVVNDTQLDKYYERLVVDEHDDYATLIHKYSIWAQDKTYRRLIEEVDRKEFGTSSAVVNAFYSAIKNGITFPAAILQAPFFDRTFPKALNYAAMGSVIGHEITHGFDDSGSQFDASGNLHNWWDPITEERFKNLTKCVIDQYNDYDVESTGLHINGVLTQGENIADNGGIRQAYQAYRNYISKLGHEEKRLPGYESYSNNQIFFIAYAQTWCGKSTKEAIIRQILVDPHSPMRYRVNGVVANQPEFAHAFNCPRASKMNPVKKCRVW